MSQRPNTSSSVESLLVPVPGIRGAPFLFVGGSHGIGLECAKFARRLGAEVILASRNLDRLAAAQSEFDRAQTIVVDAGDDPAFFRVLEDCSPEHVVLTTGTRYLGGAPYELAALDVPGVIAYLGSRLAPTLTVARWAANHGGRLRTLTTVGGFVPRRPTPGDPIRSLGPHVLVSLVEALAVELAPTRVNAVGPRAVIDSPMEDERDEKAMVVMREHLERTSPARKAVTLADTARQVMSVVIDPVVTGTMRQVDAGLGLIHDQPLGGIAR